MLDGPHALGEPVVLLVFLVAIEMEDALNEVLGEHDWIPLQQEMHQAELSKAGKEEKNDLIIRQLLKATPETLCRLTRCKAGERFFLCQVSLNFTFNSCPAPSMLERGYQLIDFKSFFIQKETDVFSIHNITSFFFLPLK